MSCRVGVLRRHLGEVSAPPRTRGIVGDIEDLASASSAHECGSEGSAVQVSGQARAMLQAASTAAAGFKVRSGESAFAARGKPIKGAADFRESLRGRGLVVYHGGEQVPEFVDHPIFAASINAMAATYELGEQDPQLATAKSQISGVQHSRFLHITESAEDVVMQNRMQRRLGQITGTCFQRCVGMDASNAMFATTYDVDQKCGTEYHARFRRFIAQAQEGNVVIGGAMTDPKGDRGRSPSQQEDPDLFVRVVGRTVDGVVIRGAKVHQTGTLNSHWMVVMPGQRLAPEDKDYAIACAVPVDGEGIVYINGRQPSDTRALEGGEIDQGNAQYGGQELVVVFDDVFVPFSRVFLDGETEFSAPIVERFTNYHRRSYICKAGLGDVLLGAAATMADYNGVAKASHVKDKLVELAYMNENIAGTALSASYQSHREPAGNWGPNSMHANVCKHNVTRFPYLAAAIAQDLAGGLVSTLPAEADFDHPVAGPLLEKYLVGAPGSTVENRRRMLRLIENMTMGRNCVGYMAESMHGAGSPQAQRVVIQRLMDPESKKKLAKRIAGIKD